eukprot:4949667-Pyramimonas_sp.AAC.1
MSNPNFYYTCTSVISQTSRSSPPSANGLTRVGRPPAIPGNNTHNMHQVTHHVTLVEQVSTRAPRRLVGAHLRGLGDAVLGDEVAAGDVHLAQLQAGAQHSVHPQAGARQPEAPP